MISIKNISKDFFSKDERIKVLENISLNFEKQSITSILGPSGCGKSTLLNIISGVIYSDTGEIIQSNGIQNRIGYAFQNDILLPWRNVSKNITLSNELNNEKSDLKKLESLLIEFEISDIALYMPLQLSGGMKQKVAFVRTIMPQPELLLLDEPFSNIDYRTKIELEEYLLKYIKQTPNRCCIFVTHNIDEAVSISDKIIFLSKKPTRVIKEKNIESNHRESLLKFRLSLKYEKLYAEVAEIINNIYENKYI